ncbi:glyoxalase [Chromobacterium sinusclupearum]|uniref:Glyoxalase n=1 Tax=Chromobacterium sinusclupearum TaxID=2077146 RepID=A0A2K4MQ30_9NEIS|nr:MULTISPECIES: VOC family protein [Chromobacterium]POA98885.1 glyoxalase [Chromobacterium sinusclupearum]
MENLASIEIKAFIPSKDFQLSQAFYQDMGFERKSAGHGVAYFAHGNCSFLLQDYYHPEFAANCMMHLLVADAAAWHAQLQRRGIAEKYQVMLGDLKHQPWGMLDFPLLDPSGVLWHIAQNLPRNAD